MTDAERQKLLSRARNATRGPRMLHTMIGRRTTSASERRWKMPQERYSPPQPRHSLSLLTAFGQRSNDWRRTPSHDA